MKIVRDTMKSGFLRSALTEESEFHAIDDVLSWLRSTPERRPQAVKRIPLSDLREWTFEHPSGDLVHASGKFFRVTGVSVTTDLGPRSHWQQPIIDQPEIGILGILAREVDGVLHLLMQAKMEPGNPLGVQLTPTVQATRSNYTQVHMGSRPLYLDHFLDRKHGRVLVDQLQWEQGSAFLRKRNRNMVIQIHDDIPVEQGFHWLTLGQIKRLLAHPNLVSMDTRTVVACMPLVETADEGSSDALDRDQAPDFALAILDSIASTRSASTDEEVMSWLTDLKCRHHLSIEHIGLTELDNWKRTETQIASVEPGSFKVVAVDVESVSREVVRWTQPMIGAEEHGLVGLLTAEIGGVLHAMVRARVEPGSHDIVTLGPTVQSALGFESGGGDEGHATVSGLVKQASGRSLRYSCLQSEEGGRFYQVVSDYRIVQVDGGEAIPVPPDCMWLTFRQMQEMVRFGLLGVEARSLLSCISFT